MPIRKGPFTVEWGANNATDVESIDMNFQQDSQDFKTLQGRTVTMDGNKMVSATFTLLGPGIDLLASLLPQYFVANGEIMSTGETVTDLDGAIDVVPRACDEELIYNNFDITDCGNPSMVVRLVNTRTQLEGMDFSEILSKVTIKVIGEAAADEGVIQFFRSGGMAAAS